nr:hypothetical protein [Streptomyces canus]
MPSRGGWTSRRSTGIRVSARYAGSPRDSSPRSGSPCPARTVDVGLIQDPDPGHERWAVMEANMPWFSHSYAARADTVLDVVLRAAGPRGQASLAMRRSSARQQPRLTYRGTFYRYVLLHLPEVARGQARRDVRSRLRVVGADPVHRR